MSLMCSTALITDMTSLRVGTFSFGNASKVLLITFCSSSFVGVFATAVDMSLRNATISS